MHFVLDHNFPWQVTTLLWPAALTISQLSVLAPNLIADHEDWETLQELAGRGDVDGFITNDAKILSQATEMVVLQKTSLALVITDGVGHDPIRATGLVMVHLQEIAKRPKEGPQVYLLRASAVQTTTPWQHINKIAGHRSIDVNALVSFEIARIKKASPRSPRE